LRQCGQCCSPCFQFAHNTLPDSGVLFHCAVGKDRTGIVAALLLSLAGVSPPDIIADYQVSGTYIKVLVERFRKEDPTIPSWAGLSKAEHMESFLQLFFSQYPSVELYLKEIGLSDDQISAIRDKLNLP